MKRRSGFTLVEIMIVVAIIGIIVTIAIPGFLRARETSRARSCQENLTKIDGAKEQYALDRNLAHNAAISGGWTDLVGGTNYLKSQPTCSAGGTYTMNAIGTAPTCNYVGPTWLSVQHALP
jgi:prepilin-type N-terminal cleavage/methylation domain-containing protein